MMICDRCSATIADGDEMTHHGLTLCEECYMTMVSPPRACDPWAVYNATLLSGRTEGEHELNASQARILALLEETGGLGMNELTDRSGLSTPQLMRELAALRHMERLKARMRDGEKLYVLWSA